MSEPSVTEMEFCTPDEIPDDVKRVAEYLASGVPVLASPGVVVWLTDGFYVWADTHVVAVGAGVSLPEPEALAYIREADYRVPPVSDERVRLAFDALCTFQPVISMPPQGGGGEPVNPFGPTTRHPEGRDELDSISEVRDFLNGVLSGSLVEVLDRYEFGVVEDVWVVSPTVGFLGVPSLLVARDGSIVRAVSWRDGGVSDSDYRDGKWRTSDGAKTLWSAT